MSRTQWTSRTVTDVVGTAGSVVLDAGYELDEDDEARLMDVLTSTRTARWHSPGSASLSGSASENAHLRKVRTMNEKIADAVEELRKALARSDESVALGDPVGDWGDDDTVGVLTMGPVRVEWIRDPYGDGEDERVPVEVSVDGAPFDTDSYSHLDEAVKDAARTTAEWQRWSSEDIRDEVVAWLGHRGECYDVDTEEDGSWTILWGYTCVQGELKDDSAFEWSVSNSQSASYLDGDASDDGDAVIDAMVACARDPWVDAWVESVAVLTAEDDWSVRTSADQMYMWQHSAAAYGVSRRAYYESVGYEEGRIELEYRVRGSEWRVFDEYLPEDEDGVRAGARKAYEWIKAVDS